MKVRLTQDAVVSGVPLQAGESAIVDDAEGALLIAAGAAVALDENERGGFAVPMQTDEPAE
jgi:hypothetical protein